MREVREAEQPHSSVARALVVMAHPDDAEFTCGGLVMQMAARGVHVASMVLTDGSKGGHDHTIGRERLVAIRQSERARSAEVCGFAQLLSHDAEDGSLEYSPALVKSVTRSIRAVRPELVICPNPERYFGGNYYINHPDHRAAANVVLAAVSPAAANPRYFPELLAEGLMPHRVRYVYVTLHDSPTVEIDITDRIEQKMEAILCHESQFADPSSARAKWLARWAEQDCGGSVRYRERFRSVHLT